MYEKIKIEVDMPPIFDFPKLYYIMPRVSLWDLFIWYGTG
jgi:hypothetical protein